MTPHLEALLSHVAGHAGIGRDEAERAALAVMSGIGAYLPDWARRLVAAELPSELGDALITGRSVALPLEELAIARGAPPHQAHELVAAVCHVLSEELSDDALVALQAALPAELARQLAPPASELTGPPAEQRGGTTLAAGRPGSAHPISDTPAPEHHRDSVADPNPHGASKLSSAEGTTQEREHETLAEGEPGPDHPLAG